ncbi:hypothetical protein BDR03DRAFT_1017378 [Suillus americanus]|nr:hypothetical protein BDR03DRAFT_1017378 [Suillus americanus]
MSDIGLLSLPLKCQHLTNSGAYCSVSQPITAGSMLLPLIADWEAGLARVTASAGLPLQWVENPEWLKLCDRFIPQAKVPLAKVLMKHVMPQVLRGIKATAKEEACGAVRTLQCDGWTGKNSHHLLGFMMTIKQKLHAVPVHDASGNSHNAEELLKQNIESINQVESEWGFLHLVTPDCLAHQFNLIVGDLFKAKDDYGQYGDLAQDLITWLHSKTHVLALLCELQMTILGKTLAIICTVLT